MNRSRILGARPCYTPRRLTDASTDGRTAVLAMLEGGTVGEVFAFFADEMPIAVNEVIGLTVAGAGAFYRRSSRPTSNCPTDSTCSPKQLRGHLTSSRRCRSAGAHVRCVMCCHGVISSGWRRRSTWPRIWARCPRSRPGEPWPRISPIRYWSNAGLRSSLPSICHGGICWSTRARLSPICHRSAADKAGAVSRSLQPALMSAP